MLTARQDLQAVSTPSRPETSEPPDLRDTFTSWTPSTGSDYAVEMLDRLPGLARAIEVWERDLPSSEQEEPEWDTVALLHIHSSSAFDGLDREDLPWRGPDPLDDWMQERID